jgi:hypothetical protein
MRFNFLQKQTSRREMLRGSAMPAGSAVLAHLFPATSLRAFAMSSEQPAPSPADLLACMRAKFKGEQQMINSMKPMRAVRGISQSLCIVFLLVTCGVLSGQNQAHRVRNIVLVHGAWADGSGWKVVYDILVNDGYNVSIVQEPETSFHSRMM